MCLKNTGTYNIIVNVVVLADVPVVLMKVKDLWTQMMSLISDYQSVSLKMNGEVLVVEHHPHQHQSN